MMVIIFHDLLLYTQKNRRLGSDRRGARGRARHVLGAVDEKRLHVIGRIGLSRMSLHTCNLSGVLSIMPGYTNLQLQSELLYVCVCDSGVKERSRATTHGYPLLVARFEAVVRSTCVSSPLILFTPALWPKPHCFVFAS